MKILNVSYNFNNLAPLQPQKQSDESKISFKGADISVFMEQLSGLENVHCPFCGTKMLNKNEIKKIFDDAENVKNSKDFAFLLSKNKESIRPVLNPLYDDVQLFSTENPDASLNELFGYLYAKSAGRVRQSIFDSIVRVMKEQKKTSYSDRDRLLLEECELRMKDMNNNSSRLYINVYKQILKDTIGSLDSREKWKLYDALKLPVKDSMLNLVTVMRNKTDNGTSSLKTILSNIFNPSVSQIKDIVGITDEDFDARGNKLLVCNGCVSGQKTILSMFRNKDVNKTFATYQADIAQNIIKNKLDGNEVYPYMIQGFVRKITYGNVDYERNHVMNELSRYRLDKDRQEIQFKPVEFDGVPCAGCGKETINHQHKLLLYKEVEETKNLWQLVNVLEKYQDKISNRNKPIVSDFRSILEEEPLISEKQLLENLRLNAANRIRLQLKENEKEIYRLMKKYGFSDSDKLHMLHFVNGVNSRFQDFNSLEKFPYGEYGDFIRETIALADNPAKYEFITLAKESIKTLYETQSLLFPPDSVVEKLRSLMKPIAQNLLNGSVATIDHMIPKNKKGINNKYNCFVLCRDCNRDKSNYSFAYWFKLHPEAERNVKKYMDFVVKLINDKKIEGFDDYPSVIATKLRNLTYQKIVLHFNLNKKD